MAKVIWLKGLEELEKLGAKRKYQFAVPGFRLVINGKLHMFSDRPESPTHVIRGTPDFVAVCRLGDGEQVPEDTPIVTRAYL